MMVNAVVNTVTLKREHSLWCDTNALIHTASFSRLSVAITLNFASRIVVGCGSGRGREKPTFVVDEKEKCCMLGGDSRKLMAHG